jgi:hypothetical protein
MFFGIGQHKLSRYMTLIRHTLNPMDFECPACKAKPQEPCRALSGEALPKPHAKRTLAALNAEHPRSKFQVSE